MTFRRRLWHLRQAFRAHSEKPGISVTVTGSNNWITAPPFAGPITAFYDAQGNLTWTRSGGQA
jgi:hypothetical protein